MAAARLPEMVFAFAAPRHANARQPVRSLVFEMRNSLAADAFLDPLQKRRIVVRSLARTHHQMHVLRNEHRRPQIIIQLSAGFVDLLGQPLAGAILRQERKSQVAGKGQFMSVSGIIVTPRALLALTVMHDVLSMCVDGVTIVTSAV